MGAPSCPPFVPQFQFLRLNLPAAPREALARHPLGALLQALQKGDVATEPELETLLMAALGRAGELEERDRDAWERAITILYLIVYHIFI